MNTIVFQHATPKPVHLVEYGDYSCERCQELQTLLTTSLPQFGDDICYTFRHFPNLANPAALLMALAAEAGRQQEHYWTMHHALFAYTEPISLNSLLKLALEVGINPEQFLDDMHDESLKKRIWADMELGRQADVVETPTLFLGIRRLHGKLTQARLVPLLTHYIGRSTASVLNTVDCENGLVLWSNRGTL